MGLLNTPACNFDWPAPKFSLQDPTRRVVTLTEAMGPEGLLVAFLCNHCPYVKAIADRLAEDARELATFGVNTVGIMSNDYRTYPADAPERMAEFADQSGWGFPYLVDEDQSAARAYGAVCTPDFFGFNAERGLQYRGRLDSAAMGPSDDRVKELVDAMRIVAQTGRGPEEQVPSMGCSIKWR